MAAPDRTELAAAMAHALRGRGVPEPTANLAAEAGIAVFKVAFARWIGEPGQPNLPEILHASMEDLRNVLLAHRAPTSPQPSESARHGDGEPVRGGMAALDF
ncbi:hypothetical protein ACIBHX_40435 [Nonomuraea sp. NPDC050536]|uniref:hypothetical protein n=1 Tax=Nonomuraea sp. NPDC050536 TaxID=3364366 RepID=UPI0037C666B4